MDMFFSYYNEHLLVLIMILSFMGLFIILSLPGFIHEFSNEDHSIMISFIIGITCCIMLFVIFVILPFV